MGHGRRESGPESHPWPTLAGLPAQRVWCALHTRRAGRPPPKPQQCLLLENPTSFWDPKEQQFYSGARSSVTQRFAHLPLLLGGSHWILVQFSSQEAPRRFRKKEFLDQSQEVVTALRACDSASCRRRARDKGIPILNTDSEIPIRKFGNSEIRTVFWQEG